MGGMKGAEEGEGRNDGARDWDVGAVAVKDFGRRIDGSSGVGLLRLRIVGLL